MSRINEKYNHHHIVKASKIVKKILDREPFCFQMSDEELGR